MIDNEIINAYEYEILTSLSTDIFVGHLPVQMIQKVKPKLVYLFEFAKKAAGSF
jgi:hypothetical protein